MSGSNIFLIFRQGVGLMIGGFTADWKFSKAKKENREYYNQSNVMLCIAMECKGPTYTKDENYDIKT